MSWKKPRYLNDDIDNLRKEILENPSEDKLQYLEYLLKLRWFTMLYEKTSFITLSDLKENLKMNKGINEFESPFLNEYDGMTLNEYKEPFVNEFDGIALNEYKETALNEFESPFLNEYKEKFFNDYEGLNE